MSLFELNRPHKTSKLDRFQSKIQFATFFYFIKNAPKSTVFKLLHFGAGFFNLKTDSTDFGDFGDFQPKIQFATFFLLHKKCSKIIFLWFIAFRYCFFKKIKNVKNKTKRNKEIQTAVYQVFSARLSLFLLVKNANETHLGRFSWCGVPFFGRKIIYLLLASPKKRAIKSLCIAHLDFEAKQLCTELSAPMLSRVDKWRVLFCILRTFLGFLGV